MENKINTSITKLKQLELLYSIPNLSVVDLFLAKNNFKLSSGISTDIRIYQKNQEINVSESQFSIKYETIKYEIILHYLDNKLNFANFNIKINDKIINKSIPANNKVFYEDRELQIMEEIQRYLIIFNLQTKMI